MAQTVATATSAQLETLFAAMAEIEAACARLAAMSMTPIERRRLQSLNAAMAGLANARGDPTNTPAANIAFHTQIYAGAHNEDSGPISRPACGGGWRVRRAQFRTEGRLSRSHTEHGAVVKAIIACLTPPRRMRRCSII